MNNIGAIGTSTAQVAQSKAGLEAWAALGRKLESQDPRVADEAAGKAVAELFFAPLLAEARELPFGRSLAYGGRTEEIFGERLDYRIADLVARADSSGLREQLADRLRAGPIATLRATAKRMGAERNASAGASAAY